MAAAHERASKNANALEIGDRFWHKGRGYICQGFETHNERSYICVTDQGRLLLGKWEPVYTEPPETAEEWAARKAAELTAAVQGGCSEEFKRKAEEYLPKLRAMRERKRGSKRSRQSREYECQECGRGFTAKAAERASLNGCPKCGSVDVDLAPIT